MSKIYTAQDFFQLTSREMTSEGYLKAPGTLARTGVQEYRAYEFGLDKEMGMDPMRVIRMYRPAEEVFAPDSMVSFEHQPITVEHPAGNVVTADNWQELAKGEVFGITCVGDKMNGTLLVKSKDAIEAIMSGKSQLSNGYSFQADWTPGTTADGQKYDGVQRNIRGNHVAIVDAARCGSACRIADSNPLNSGDSTMSTQKVIVDGIPLEVSDTAAAAINKLMQQGADATKQAADAQAKVTNMVDGKVHADAIAAKDAEIAELKKDVMTPAQRDAMVADWSKMIGDGKVLAPEVTSEGKTCVAYRREVVAAVAAKDSKAKAAADAVLGGKTLEAADADTVRAVFNVLVATASTENQSQATGDAAKVAAALAGKSTQTGDAAAQPVGREAMLARSQAYLNK